MVAKAPWPLFKKRSMRFEQLENRSLLASDAVEAEGEASDFLTPAYELLHQRADFNRHFYVYKNGDAGDNQGQPSGYFAGEFDQDRPDLRLALSVNTACVNDPHSLTGCSSNPLAADRARGTVVQISIPPLVKTGEFAGVNFVEGTDNGQSGQGYDLSDATHVLLEAYSQTGAKVQFAIGSKSTDRESPYNITNSWISISIPLNALRDPGTNLPSLPDLAHVRSLFGVTFSNGFSGGGSIQLDNIRFVRLVGGDEFPPANPTGIPRIGLPLGTESFGVVPAVLHVEDNGSNTFQTLVGNWNNLPEAQAYAGNQNTTSLALGTPSPAAMWTIGNLQPRNYVVQATWLDIANNTKQAKYQLLDGNESRGTFNVDQSQSPAGDLFDGTHWQSLGTVRVVSGSLVVKLSSDESQGNLVADAVRLVPTIPPDQAFPNLATVYEAALTVDALLHRGLSQDLVTARLISDSLVYAQQHDSLGLGAGLPLSSEGHRGIRNAYAAGDLPLRNGENSSTVGQVRLAGFTSDTRLCGASRYCVTQIGAAGGNSAFVIMALMRAYFEFHDVKYLNAAEEIGGWIVGNLTDLNGPAFNFDTATQSYGGYFTGYEDDRVSRDRVTDLIHSKSIENNADIYAAFTAIAQTSAAMQDAPKAALWQQRANIAGDFVLAMYAPGSAADDSDGHFYGGTLSFGLNGPSRGPGLEPDGPRQGDDVINVASFLDANTFSVLSLASSSRYHDWLLPTGVHIDWREPIRYAVKTFAQDVTVTVDSVQHDLQGFSLTAQPTGSQFRPGGPIDGLANGIAWEFVGQMIMTMQVLDELYDSSEFSHSIQRYLTQTKTAQSVAPFTDGLGLVASTLDGESNSIANGFPPLDQCLSTPFQCIPERVGLAATTWGIYANTSHNIFYLSPWHNPVEPLDVNGDRFVTAIDALLVINRINTIGTDRLPNPPSDAAPADAYYDVDGNGSAIPLDVLLIINRLNQKAASAEGEWRVLDAANESIQPPQHQEVPLANRDYLLGQFAFSDWRMLNSGMVKIAQPDLPEEFSTGRNGKAVVGQSRNEVIELESFINSIVYGFADAVQTSCVETTGGALSQKSSETLLAGRSGLLATEKELLLRLFT